MALKKEGQLYSVQLADTWHQPLTLAVESDSDTDGADEEESPPIFTLNEDCLLEVFKRCGINELANLSKVCKSFKNVLGRHIFPYIHSMPDFNQLTLAEARKILRCIGSYVQTLNGLHIPMLRCHHFKRYLQKLNQYVGDSVRELKLCYPGGGFFFKSDLYIPLITAILPRLHTLILVNLNGSGLDFQAHCLNLTKLKLIFVRGLNDAQNLSLPNLTYLSFIPCRLSCTSEAMIGKLIAQNPQLTCFKTTDKYITSDRVEYMSNVEKISISFNSFNFRRVELNNLTHLAALKKLTKLTLFDLNVCDLVAVCELVTKLSSLIELKIYVGDNAFDRTYCKDYQTPLLSVGQDLSHLEKVLLHGVTLSKTTIVEFVRFAKKLQSLHIHCCKMLVSCRDEDEREVSLNIQNLVVDVAEARKSIGCKKIDNGPLKLFIDREYYDELNMTYENRFPGYLAIHSECKHQHKFKDRRDERY